MQHLIAYGLSLEMVLVMGILLLAVYLFVFDVVRVDMAGLAILVLLGLISYIPGIEPVVAHSDLLSGFSSNAVIAIIAVMIIGSGLDRTGLMSELASLILKYGKRSSNRILLMVMAAAAFISSFMQNIGCAALLLPLVSRLSARTGIPMSQLVMPMGTLVILGGTITMIGASPQILLNDLLISLNKSLPADAQMAPFGLFAIAPTGVALCVCGILYFWLAGRFILPGKRNLEHTTSSIRTSEYFNNLYGIKGELVEARVSVDSPLAGRTIAEVDERFPDAPKVLALFSGDVVKVAPAPDETLWVNTRIGLMGDRARVQEFCEQHHWEVLEDLDRFVNVLDSQQSGIAEVVIPPRSSLIGQTIGNVKPRRNYGANILQIYRSEQVIRRGFTDVEVHAGDTLVIHTRWKDLLGLTRDPDFVVVTEVKYDDFRTSKVGPALMFTLVGLLLFLFTGNLSLSLLAGAVGMVFSGVLTMDEAYGAVSWQTVFLLASLIPLGMAADQTGAAAWIAEHLITLMGDVPNWVVQTVVALLATFFSLVMSNIGATVLLVPLAVNIAISSGADPALYALIVAVSASNAFLIPTNQVNALLMGPGGYSVADFMRAGGFMTIIFLVVSLVVLNLTVG